MARGELLEQAGLDVTWWAIYKEERGLEENLSIEVYYTLCTVDDKGNVCTPNTELLYNNGLATEEEYQIWLGLQKPKAPTEIEILRQEKEILAQSVYDLTTIVELILTGGIVE